MDIPQAKLIRPIDILRKQMLTEREKSLTPLPASITSRKDLHHRSSTQNMTNIDHFTRDVSHRLDRQSKIRSRFEILETQLHEILGIKPKVRKMPTTLEDLQASVKKLNEPDSKSSFLQDLEKMKLEISAQKEQLLQKIVKEGGLLYRTQAGLIQPQVSNIYEHILKRGKNHNAELPRYDMDLGEPSSRKEVEIIIA